MFQRSQMCEEKALKKAVRLFDTEWDSSTKLSVDMSLLLPLIWGNHRKLKIISSSQKRWLGRVTYVHRLHEYERGEFVELPSHIIRQWGSNRQIHFVFALFDVVLVLISCELYVYCIVGVYFRCYCWDHHIFPSQPQSTNNTSLSLTAPTE